MRYHNTPKGPRVCRANPEKQRGCPYEAAGGEHFSTQKEAQAAYEKTMTQAFGMVPSVSRFESKRQRTYNDVDVLRKVTKKVTDPAKKAVAVGLLLSKKQTRENALAYVKTRGQQQARRSAFTMKETMLRLVARAADRVQKKANSLLETKYGPQQLEFSFS